jgi:hypothetical protein
LKYYSGPHEILFFLDPFPNNMGIFRFNSGNNGFKNYSELIGKIVGKSTINYRK